MHHRRSSYAFLDTRRFLHLVRRYYRKEDGQREAISLVLNPQLQQVLCPCQNLLGFDLNP